LTNILFSGILPVENALFNAVFTALFSGDNKMSFSFQDLIHAVLLLLVVEGCLYLFIPKAIQSFAVSCIIEANPHNLRLFGAILILLALFLRLFVFQGLSE